MEEDGPLSLKGIAAKIPRRSNIRALSGVRKKTMFRIESSA